MNAYRPMQTNTLPSYSRYNPYTSGLYSDTGPYGSSSLSDLTGPYDSSYLNALKNINNRNLSHMNSSLTGSPYSSSNYITNPYTSKLGSGPSSFLSPYQPDSLLNRPMDELDMEFARMEAATNPNYSVPLQPPNSELISDKLINKVKRDKRPNQYVPAVNQFADDMPGQPQRPRPVQPTTKEEFNVATNYAGRLTKNIITMGQSRSADQTALNSLLVPRLPPGGNLGTNNNFLASQRGKELPKGKQGPKPETTPRANDKSNQNLRQTIPPLRVG
jgi:hypothetical protein